MYVCSCSVAEKDDDMVNAAGTAQQLDLLAWFSYGDGCAWKIGGSCGGGTVMVGAVVMAALKKFVIAGVVRCWWWWWWVVWWWGDVG